MKAMRVATAKSETSGNAQAETYMSGFDKIFAALRDGSAITRSTADVKPDLRKVQVGRHVVFFRETAERIEVVRVLQSGWIWGEFNNCPQLLSGLIYSLSFYPEMQKPWHHTFLQSSSNDGSHLG